MSAWRLVAVVEDSAAAVPKERPRRGKGGHFYTPQRTVNFETVVAWLCKTMCKERGLTGDISLELEIGKDFWKAKIYESAKTDAQKGGDLDNILKSVTDGIQKSGVIVNDKQIVEIHARKGK